MDPQVEHHLLNHPWFVPFSEIPKNLKKEIVSVGDVANMSFFDKSNTIVLGDYNCDHTISLRASKTIAITFGTDSKIIFGCRPTAPRNPKSNRYGGTVFFLYPMAEYLVSPNVQAPLPSGDKMSPPPPQTSFTPVGATEQPSQTPFDERSASWIKQQMKPKQQQPT